jgi:Protein of unknown function (DUF2442)
MRKVIEVDAIDPLQLRVKFDDGLEGIVRFERSHLTGVFTALKDFNFFAQAHVEDGAVVWPNNIDLAPDAMYAAIKEYGEWVLR